MKNNHRHSCPETPRFAPSNAVGPAEFDHALECDECWAALIRWMDTEVNNLPESADIRARAERLASVEEIMGAMVPATRPGIEAIPDEEFDDVTLADVLDATQVQTTVVRGPWTPIRRGTTHNKLMETDQCANGKTDSSSPSNRSECSAEMPETPPEDVCRRRPMKAAASRTTTADCVRAGEIAGVPAGVDAADVVKLLARSLRNIGELSTREIQENLCMGITRYAANPLCDDCVFRGQCRLREEPHVTLNFNLEMRVPLNQPHQPEEQLN